MEDRLTFSCQDPQSLISEQFDDRTSGFMADLFDVIAGLHGFLEPGNGAPDEQSDSDESFMESDDGDDVFEEEGDLNLWMDGD